jgi:hypothetical protein
LSAGGAATREIGSKQFPRKKTSVAGVSNHESEIAKLVAEAEQTSSLGIE